MAFPRNYWDPDAHYAVHVIEFLATKWKDRTRPDDPPSAPADIDAEIAKLVALKGKRPGLRADIEFHATGSFFSTLFPRRLMFNRYSHPATFEVLRVGVHLPNFVAVYYKDMFQRDRPSRISPEVDPMIEVPGHASYPSGHSTQAYLAAHLLQRVHPDGDDPRWQKDIFDLAQHVAFCREVAGVHYESDSIAGKKLARAISDILDDPGPCPGFHKLLTAATSEW